jgi:heme A synthase
MAILQRLIGIAAVLLLGVAALIFASIILALGTAIALVLGGWLWWRSRRLSRNNRGGGTVIEGEFRVEDEVQRLEERR